MKEKEIFTLEFSKSKPVPKIMPKHEIFIPQKNNCRKLSHNQIDTNYNISSLF
jgi:hypothetical protein